MSIADTLVIWNFKKPEINCSICLGKGSQFCFQLWGVSQIRVFEKSGYAPTAVLILMVSFLYALIHFN